ncbi:hypothetical protein H477_3213 [[Clostridium] sordellii ATCC 9714]|nr:hypothetical protein H477_3213 [[Clostridium] sordellii ATCC 9714] [Paeniclostridium sordellii ATCC 9714]
MNIGNYIYFINLDKVVKNIIFGKNLQNIPCITMYYGLL